MKKDKIAILSAAIVFGLLVLMAIITNIAGKCSADEPNADKKRIENLLLMQKDSLESAFLARDLRKMDSLEAVLLKKIEPLKAQNDKLQAEINKKTREISVLKHEFSKNPTLENCENLVNQQNIVIAVQADAIDSLDKEAQQWCELYENENVKGILKDSILARKDRTINTLNREFSEMQSQVTAIDHKLNGDKWLKRNWLWATNSYRNYLKNRK
jgi:predicted RNase H-like nuclease (RuvC/YqgF family)